VSRREFQDLLQQEITALDRARILILCPWDLGPLPEHVTLLSHPGELSALTASGRTFALAVTAGVLEDLEAEDGGVLLASLRDLKAARLLVAVPAVTDHRRHRSTWPLEHMLAHGLEARRILGTGDAALALYGFDIDHYKKTPEWLNSRNWANPENWNRFRW